MQKKFTLPKMIHKRRKRSLSEYLLGVFLPFLLSVFLMMTDWALFGSSTALFSVPFVSMFVNLEHYRAKDWPVYRMILLPQLLMLCAYLANLNIFLGLVINLIVVYFLVFYFTDHKSSRVYFEYGYIYIISESFSIKASDLLPRSLAVFWCIFWIYLFLMLASGIDTHSKKPDVNLHNLIPFHDFKRIYKSFREKNVRALKSLHHIILHPFHKKHHYFVNEKNFHFHKTRFALRMSLSISFCFFISTLLDLPKNVWLPLNVFLMMMPYYDASIKNIRLKIFGNVLAVLISALFLMVFRQPVSYLVLIILLTYLSYAYPTSFQKTMYSVSVVMLVGSFGSLDAHELLLLRLFYVILAVIIALLSNSFVYPNPSQTELEY